MFEDMGKIEYEGKMIDHPCDHCVNPNNLEKICVDKGCYWFSHFVAGPDTPKDVRNYVEDMREW